MTKREAKRRLRQMIRDGRGLTFESECEALDVLLAPDRPTQLEREAERLMLTLTPAIGEWHDAHKRTFNRMVAWRKAYNRKAKR